MGSLLQHILSSKKTKNKLLAVLIDPEKFNKEIVLLAQKSRPDFIFLGGSTVTKRQFNSAVRFINKNCSVPLVIFPGDEKQISNEASAFLLLSLLSGRNPEFLIGKQVKSAMTLKKSGLEIISTAYILLDERQKSSVSRVTGTRGISQKKIKEILSTALAGEQLGFQCVYLEAGSGVIQKVSEKIIHDTSQLLKIPLIVGGGINSEEKAVLSWRSGADIVVVGNAIEKNPELMNYFCKARNKLNNISARK